MASNLLRRIGDAWVGRWAKPEPQAHAAVAHFKPAVLITGASEGIGRALALHLDPRSAALILIARRAEPLEKVAGEIRALPNAPVVRTIPLDITRPDAADTIARIAAEAGLYVDELINNAGIGLSGPFASQNPAEVATLVALNVDAATRLMHQFLPAMLARGRGGVMNIASLGGYAPGPFQAAYYASKAYLISLTRAVAWEERGRGVRIAVVSPGPVQTGFHARMGAESAFYRLVLPSPDAAAVARSAVRSYDAGLGAIHPGPLTSAAAVLMTVIPRVFLLPFIGWLLWPGRSGR